MIKTIDLEQALEDIGCAGKEEVDQEIKTHIAEKDGSKLTVETKNDKVILFLSKLQTFDKDWAFLYYAKQQCDLEDVGRIVFEEIFEKKKYKFLVNVAVDKPKENKIILHMS